MVVVVIATDVVGAIVVEGATVVEVVDGATVVEGTTVVDGAAVVVGATEVAGATTVVVGATVVVVAGTVVVTGIDTDGTSNAEYTSRFGLPVPILNSAPLVAFATSICSTCCWVSVGLRCSIVATMPETMGAAFEVPLLDR